MKRAAWGGLAILATLWGFSNPVTAGERLAIENDRGFRNYTREAATVGQGNIRVELRGMEMQQEDPHPNLDLLGFPVPDDTTRIQGGVIDLLGSYGLGKRAEIGLDIPFFIQETGIEGHSSRNEEGIGDILLYAKSKHEVAQNCAVAGGLELTLPSGSESKGFGTGETGMNPFVSSRYQRERFAVGVQLGYQIFTGGVDDVLNYGFNGTVRGSDMYSLRVELAGRLFETGGVHYHDVTLLPGIDVRMSEKFTIRPTGLIGLTGDAMDWGVGLGLALQL